MTLPGGPPLEAVPHPWTAVYTKPRQEKAVAGELERRGVSYFLPLAPRVSSSGGRRRTYTNPLFTSYVFYAGDEVARDALAKTNRVVQFVEIAPGEQERFRREISSLELALRTSGDQPLTASRLVEGVRVQVIGGPLKGAEGIVLNAERATKLWIGVSLMGAGVQMEIHADLVEPIDREVIDRRGQIEYQVGAGQFIATSV